MTDERDEIPTNPPVRLMIQLENGQVSLGGPIGDPLLCYGLLEAAKDVLRAHQVQQQRRRVEPVTLIPKGLVQP